VQAATGLLARAVALPGFYAWVWAAASMVSVGLVMGLEPNLLEEGLVVHIAQRVAQGEHLYRDIVYFTGPLPFELLGLLFRIFGEDMLVVRLALFPLIGLATGTTYAIARRAGAGPLAHVAAAVWASMPALGFPLFHIYFYTTVAAYLMPAVGYAALRGLESARWAAAAGVGIAALALSKQAFGLALALVLVPTLFALLPRERRMRTTGACIAGGVAVAALAFGFYVLRGELGAFVHALAQLPFELEGSFNVPYLNLWPPGVLESYIQGNSPLYMPNLMFYREGLLTEYDVDSILLTQLFYALPFLALGATLLRRLQGPLPGGVWIHAAVLVAFWTNVYPRGDWGHVVFALPAAVVQLLLLVPVHWKPGPTGRRALVAASVLLCVGLYTSTVVVGTWLNTVARRFHYGQRVPLFPVSPSYRMRTIPDVIAYLTRRIYPGEEIYIARQEPLLYFATGTKNPTSFPGMMLAMRERQDREVLDALARIRFVIMSDIDQPLYHYYADEMVAVQDYLERHYRVPYDFEIDDQSWLLVLERGPDRGPTYFDFIKNKDSARFWTRDAQGRIHYGPDQTPKLPVRQVRRPFGLSLDAGGGGADFELVLPPRAAFQASLGVPGMTSIENIHPHPGGARHALSIARKGEPFKTLATVRLSDYHEDEWRRWRDFNVDLSEYAGQAVTLRLEIIAESPAIANEIAWFGSPRLIQLIEAGT
jgi:hypothetical protein